MGLFGKLFSRGERLSQSGHAIDVYPAPASESARRVSLVLPKGPSHDARSILTAPRQVPGSGPPYEGIDFIVEVRLPIGAMPSAADVWKAAESHLRANLFVRAMNEPWRPLSDEAGWGCAQVRFALRLFSVTRDAQVRPSRENIEAKFFPALNRLAAHFAATLAPVQSLDSIAERQEKLAKAWQIGVAEAACAVFAPRGHTFNGKAVFDVLISLGFEWGDADLFHWEGGLITVSTRTPPGYFLPEDAAAGRLRVDNLRFTMAQLACCPAPDQLYAQMVRAAEYVRKRLGGSVKGGDAEPLDVEADIVQLRTMADGLTALGLPPGSGAALALVSAG